MLENIKGLHDGMGKYNACHIKKAVLNISTLMTVLYSHFFEQLQNVYITFFKHHLVIFLRYDYFVLGTVHSRV